tara:strand:+ start:997 stop:1626 length:630 start_codon:yes stop_codon:yes gene_type:complete
MNKFRQTMLEYTIKLVIVGNTNTGKSSICRSIVHKEFEYESNQTIGVDFFTTNISQNGVKFKLHLWDTAGQERFRSITSTYYRNSAGVFCVYDINNIQTLESLPSWICDVKKMSPDACIVIVGNKNDIKSPVETQDTSSDAQKMADEYKCGSVTVSSKTRHGIQDMVELMVSIIHQKTILTKALHNKNCTIVRNGEMSPSKRSNCFCVH